MNTSCDSLIVSLDKEGPIHAWEWNPAGDTFCVIYGFMPGKIGLFNKKADLVHTFPGSQYRNGMLYNPFGSLLVLYGHGNIRGAFEVWDMKLMKKVSSQDSEYMTNLEWSPDGSILLAATTSPRLKVSNKHTFYHYTGKQLLDKPYSGELFQVCWGYAAGPVDIVERESKEYGGFTNEFHIFSECRKRCVPSGVRVIVEKSRLQPWSCRESVVFRSISGSNATSLLKHLSSFLVVTFVQEIVIWSGRRGALRIKPYISWV